MLKQKLGHVAINGKVRYEQPLKKERGILFQQFMKTAKNLNLKK